jgi:hypothetical protein
VTHVRHLCAFSTHSQEVDEGLWLTHWRPLLQQQLGLSGLFMARRYGGNSITGSREGMALLWRGARFQLLGHMSVVFRDMVPTHTMPGEGGCATQNLRQIYFVFTDFTVLHMTM